MKQKVLALLLFAMTLVISSCSKEVSDSHIVGCWKFTNYKYEFFDGNGALLNSYEGVIEGTTIEFSSNGSYKFRFPEENREGTYTFTGKSLSLLDLLSNLRLKPRNLLRLL